jgi:cyclic-di-GMP phosphodiesterase TipF (flagellum assembly factor)
MGFRFGLEAVTDLDMDFAGLKKMGFAFVELDAPVFLDGLPCAGGRIPAADVCRHLADFGLTLVVGHIDDDWLLARILGFGVMFGKGTLFGGPRLVKDEVVAGHAAA